MPESNIDAGGAVYSLSLEDELSREIQAVLDGAAKAVKGVVAEVDRTVRSIGEGYKKLGRDLVAVGASTTAAGAGISLGFGSAISAAGDFAETVNMFEAVFKSQTVAVNDWADNYAKDVGRSRQQLMRFLAESQDTFVPLGFDRQEAAELSKTVTKLAIDLGSFKNINDGDALRRLLGGIIGNTENLRAFGVVAQEAQIKAKALELGFDPSNLTAYEKALSILQITIDGTTDAQGDAIRTSNSFVNSVKKMKSAFADLQVQIGEPLREVAAVFIRGIAAVVQGAADLLKEFPIISQAAAVFTGSVTAVGAALTTVGGAMLAAGALLTKFSLAAFIAQKTGVSLAGIFTRLAGMAARFGAAIGAAYLKLTLGLAFRTVVASILVGLKVIVSAVVAAGAAMSKALLNPWTLLAAAIVAAAEALKYYYDQKKKKEELRALDLERQRQEVVAQSFRDAGQPVPEDLSLNGRINDYSNARVVSSDSGIGPLSNAQQSLAKEIKSFQNPLERFQKRIEEAGLLLKRGVIDQSQFDAFKLREEKSFNEQDPAVQERNNLLEQMKTPVDRFNEAVKLAKRVFKDEPQKLEQAMKMAREQLRQMDPAEQMRQQLASPLERFRDSVENAKKLFPNDPEYFKRAVVSAFRGFFGSEGFGNDPLQGAKDQLQKAQMELASVLGGGAENLRGVFQRLNTEFEKLKAKTKDDPDVKAAGRLRDSLLSDVQRAAKKIAEAVRLVGKGLLSQSELRDLVSKVQDGLLGEGPQKEINGLATSSALVASNIGSFAPSFRNDESEQRNFRAKSIELQRATRDAVKEMARKRPLLT